MYTYLDVRGDIILPYEPSIEGLVASLVGCEVEASLFLDRLGLVVDKGLGGEVLSVRTFGLEQRQIIGTWRPGRR